MTEGKGDVNDVILCVVFLGFLFLLVFGTQQNTMTDCKISNSKDGGLGVLNSGLMTIDGDATTIHDNCTGGRSNSYGLRAGTSSSSIHLKSLTIESISTNNGGGGNYGGRGKITSHLLM